MFKIWLYLHVTQVSMIETHLKEPRGVELTNSKQL